MAHGSEGANSRDTLRRRSAGRLGRTVRAVLAVTAGWLLVLTLISYVWPVGGYVVRSTWRPDDADDALNFELNCDHGELNLHALGLADAFATEFQIDSGGVWDLRPLFRCVSMLSTTRGDSYISLDVSAWLVIGLLLAYPLGHAVWQRRRTTLRRARGLCLTCGYNLAGNTSGRCPECGATLVD